MESITEQDLKQAEVLWDFMKEQQPLEKSQAIVGLGSFDSRVAVHCAQLFLEGWADFIVFTGGIAHQHDLAKTSWGRPEAEVFAEIAMKEGVPEEKIIQEVAATNTGENFELTEALLEQQGIRLESAIVVSKPYMGKRSLATGKKRWPNKNLVFSSENIDFYDYLEVCESPSGVVINIMMGDFQRLGLYAEKGFQIPIEIPSEAQAAMHKLKERGFDKHLIK